MSTSSAEAVSDGLKILHSIGVAKDVTVPEDKGSDRVADHVIDKEDESRNIPIPQLLVGDGTAKEVVHEHLKHQHLYFRLELDSDHFFVTGQLVRTKRFGLKPMDGEEAIEQMELLGHDFFLFHYADEDVMGRGGLAPGAQLLEKPFTPAQLRDRVYQILQSTVES